MSIYDKELQGAVSAAHATLGERTPAVASNGFYSVVGKRCLDIVLTLFLAPLAILIIGVLALCLLVSGGKPFYIQRRIGRNGVVFPMVKLRTMVVDAEQALEDYLAANPAERIEWDRDQKLKKDPRVTRFGKLLRKSSLDELPQLFNVLIGQMSLVGPRPMMVDQKSLYPGLAYYKMRPGITGYWQISERNACEFRDRANYDTAYYKELSFGNDVSVLLKTAGVVFRCGAY